MPNETIEDAWKEMRARSLTDVDDENALAIMQAAFYVGSYSTMLRARGYVADQGLAGGVKEFSTDTEAEFEEFRQRVRDFNL